MLLYQDENRLNLLNIWSVLLWTESVVLSTPSLISTLAMPCSALNTCQPMLECSFQHWCCVNSCAHICWQRRDSSCLGAVLLCFQSACNKDHSQNEYSSRSLCELNTAALMLLLCYAICLSCVCLFLLLWGRSSELTILLWFHYAFLSQVSKAHSRLTDDTSPGGLLCNQQKWNSVFQGLEYLGHWAVVGSYVCHNLHGIFSAPALFFCSQRCLKLWEGDPSIWIKFYIHESC